MRKDSMSMQAGGISASGQHREEADEAESRRVDAVAPRVSRDEHAGTTQESEKAGLDDEPVMQSMDAAADASLEDENDADVDTGGNGQDNGSQDKSKPRKQRLGERIEAFISRLSTRSNFWHRVCSLIWLPYAFHSGIKMKRLSTDAFVAVLPFRRFNRNWYNAMAGAALLGNTEIAGGLYVFGVAGEKYTVVCKNLQYKFLRPCMGPAVYRVNPREDVHALLASGGEFNITLEIDVSQQLRKPGTKDKRVGKAEVIFHVTPKVHHKEKRQRRKAAKTKD